MKYLRILNNNLKDSIKSVFRNFSLSVASISCITITLILVAVAILLSENVNKFTDDIEKDVTIVVYIKKDATEEDRNALDTKINLLSNIESVTFMSKEAIRKDMSKDSEGLGTILSEYDENTNPLLDEYLVKVKDTEKIGTTAKQIKDLSGVSQVKYGEGMVEELVKIFDTVKKIMVVIVIGLVIVTAFLISNTIKITINNRKRQIEIMRLVGASNSYIKMPFFFEGIILGFIGSIIPVLFSLYGYVYLYDKMNGILFTEVISLINPNQVMTHLIITLILIGVIVGAIGSSRAVRRYLKI
ncbi:cell division protein [Clostridium sp. CAG:628]|nr:cell division protein [Clostridium sp. CAG:628]